MSDDTVSLHSCYDLPPPSLHHTHLHNLHSFSKLHRGSGFIAKLEIDGQEKVLLLTCHHIFPSLSEAQNSRIYFGRITDSDDDSAGNNTETEIRGKELFDSSYFKTDKDEVSLICYMQYM